MTDEIEKIEELPEIRKLDPKHVEEFYGVISQKILVTVESLVRQYSDDKALLAATLRCHQETIKTLRVTEEAISAALIKVGIEYGGEAIEGVGFVEVHRTGDKKRTDNALIASKVKSKLTVDMAVDEETGEIDEKASKAVAKTVDTMVQLTGANTESFTGWRKRVALTLDIDVNKYETREGGRLVVNIR